MRTLKIGYRRDIQGLRGVACLLVVFCHFNVPGFDDGYIGVDIFFVLSGFLITQMLAKLSTDQNQETSILNSFGAFRLFILKRTARIVPAALVVGLLTALMAYLKYSELHFKQVLRDFLFSISFLANLHFSALDANYFTKFSSTSLFQHYWSLAVEWQFYIFFGLFFTLARFLHVNQLLRLLIIEAFLFGSLLVFLTSASDSTSTYYSTSSRSWELVAGSVAFLVQIKSRRLKKLSSSDLFFASSLLLIFGSAFLPLELNWKIRVILAVCGTSLIMIHSGISHSMLKRVLESKFLVSTGQISYSLYLIHWPVYILILKGSQRVFLDTAIALFVSFSLAILSYNYIELKFNSNPMKKFDAFSKQKRVKNIYLSSLAIMIFAYMPYGIIEIHNEKKLVPYTSAEIIAPTYSTSEWKHEILLGTTLNQLPIRVFPSLADLNSASYGANDKLYCLQTKVIESPDCSFGSTSKEAKIIVVLGDSHAFAVLPAIAAVFDLSKFRVIPILRANCQVAFEPTNTKGERDCAQHRIWAQNKVKEIHPYAVILQDSGSVNPAVDFQTNLSKSLLALAPQTDKLIYLGWIYGLPKIVECLTRTNELTPECNSVEGRWYEKHQLLAEVAVRSIGGLYINPMGFFCTKSLCPVVIGDIIVTADGAHITTPMAIQLGRLLRPVINGYLEK